MTQKNTSKPALPQWMRESGFRSFDMISHDALLAQMQPSQPDRTRVYAWMQVNSWGCQSPLVLRPGSPSLAAHQADICRELRLNKSSVSRVVELLEEEGWIKLEGKKSFYLLARPKLKVEDLGAFQKQKALDAEDGSKLPDFKEWFSQAHPDRWKAYQTALEVWAEARRLEADAKREYDQIYLAEEPSHAPEKVAVRETSKNSKVAVHKTKSCGTGIPILIPSERHTKKVSECISLIDISNSLTHHFQLRLAPKDTLGKRFQQLAESIGCTPNGFDEWCFRKAKAKKGQGYTVRSLGAVFGFAQAELATWWQDNQPEKTSAQKALIENLTTVFYNNRGQQVDAEIQGWLVEMEKEHPEEFQAARNAVAPAGSAAWAVTA